MHVAYGIKTYTQYSEEDVAIELKEKENWAKINYTVWQDDIKFGSLEKQHL